jgi:hypothetical protein
LGIDELVFDLVNRFGLLPCRQALCGLLEAASSPPDGLDEIISRVVADEILFERIGPVIGHLSQVPPDQQLLAEKPNEISQIERNRAFKSAKITKLSKP